MKKLVIITGTTATGKTELGIELAKRLNGEVISADSMMVYRYMDIGTAKPTKEEMRGIPHHIIDVVNPDETFDVEDFLKLAKQKIDEIQKKGKLPIIVGGTWLYIQALLYGISEAPPADWKLREKLYKEDSEKLYQQLKKVDPEYSKKIHPNDKKRVIRALEVFFLTGRPFSSFHKWEKSQYEFIGFVLNRDKNQLMNRIEKRVDKMFELGLVEEVKNLLDMGFEKSLTAMQAIGYKELIPYFYGKTTLEDAKSDIIKNTKAFAKRQIRTFKNKFKDENWQHIDISSYSINEMADKIEKNITKEVN